MVHKVLVLRSSPIKYFVQSIPALAAIRKFHENDEVSVLTTKNLVRFCKKSGFFDKVWLDSQPEWFDVQGVYDIIKRLRAGNFAFIYDLDNTKRSEWYFRLMGFNKPLWNSSVVDWCSHPYIPEAKENEEYIHFQDTLRKQLSVANIHRTPNIDISYMKKRHNFDDLPEKFVMICAAGDKEKLGHKWDPVNYSELIDYMEVTYGLRSVLVGDDHNDYWINKYVIDNCRTAKPINYSGKTTIRGLINVAMKAQFCIGNETAPTHIAAYARAKTIMLCSRFSPPEKIAPRVKNLAIIEEHLLEDLSVDRVIYTVNNFAIKGSRHEQMQYRVAKEPTIEDPKEAELVR